MGLDISVYRKLSPASPVLNEHGEPEDYDNHFQAYVNPNFPGRADGVEDRAWYAFADSDGFRAGSYSGYNMWREWLAKVAGYPAVLDPSYRSHPTHSAGAWAVAGGPFWELICFADNEGVIGPVVSAKLAADFAEFDDRAKAAGDAEGWDYKLYQKWREAFEMASDGGAVDFH